MSSTNRSRMALAAHDRRGQYVNNGLVATIDRMHVLEYATTASLDPRSPTSTPMNQASARYACLTH